MRSAAQLDQFIAELRAAPDSAAFFGQDKAKEITYMVDNRYRFVRVLDLIPRREAPLRILDIGPTPFTLLLKRLLPHYAIHALDRTPWMLERCHAAGIELRTCDLDQEPPPFDACTFDVVVFTEVLEHVFAPPSDVLRGIKRLLRPEGTLILSVPNLAALHSRLRLLFGVSPLANPDGKMQKDRPHGHGHLHEYTMQEISRIVEGVGFRIGRRRYLHQSVTSAMNVTPASAARRMLRLVYHAAHVVWPAFRMGILLECQVNQTP